jgi:hypothetical protein
MPDAESPLAHAVRQPRSGMIQRDAVADARRRRGCKTADVRRAAHLGR